MAAETDVRDVIELHRHHLQFGVVELRAGTSVAVLLGDHVLPLADLAERRAPSLGPLIRARNLNPLLAAGRDVWDALRSELEDWLDRPDLIVASLRPVEEVAVFAPIEVGDYVDFYASRLHAENASAILRPGARLLHPNWLQIPVAYHGRAGTVVASGCPIVRPRGLRSAGDGSDAEFGPTRKLDLEAELGFVLGGATRIGEPISPAQARDHIFGVVVLNDWSARDIQMWETVPLGPFTAKAFATSIGSWVLPIDLLAGVRVPPPPREYRVSPYLRSVDDWALDITLQVELNGTTVARPRCRDLYWTVDQQLAQMTVTGASVRAGDLIGSGTVSSHERDWGSLLELTRDGALPIALADGSRRGYLEDGDTVTISATALGPHGRQIALSPVSGTIRPAVAAR